MGVVGTLQPSLPQVVSKIFLNLQKIFQKKLIFHTYIQKNLQIEKIARVNVQKYEIIFYKSKNEYNLQIIS